MSTFGFQPQPTSTLQVKVFVGDQIKRFRIPVPISLANLIGVINKTFKTNLTSSLQYADEENDWITIEKEEEWTEVLQVISPQKVLKLKLDDEKTTSKHLEQTVEKTIYQLEAFASAVQREGQKANSSKAVRSVFEIIRSQLKDLIPADVWADIFGGSAVSSSKPQDKVSKEQEFNLEVDLKSSTVSVTDASKNVPLVPAPVPALVQQTPVHNASVPAYSSFVFTQPQQQVIQPTQPPSFGSTFNHAMQPQLQPQPQIQQAPLQQPTQPFNRAPEQSWTFMEVGNSKGTFTTTPPTTNTPPNNTEPKAPAVPTRYAAELKQLQEMGLPSANLAQLLDKYQGNIGAVIQEVFSTT